MTAATTAFLSARLLTEVMAYFVAEECQNHRIPQTELAYLCERAWEGYTDKDRNLAMELLAEMDGLSWYEDSESYSLATATV